MFPDVLALDRAIPYLAAALAGGYLAGSIPFGLLIARLTGGDDIRSVGSGNIGATNVLRARGRGAAGLTLTLDLLKGLAAVLIATEWGPLTAAAAGAGAVIGHCFPVWLGFRGGKGVATAFGALLGWNWVAALLAFAVWLALFSAFRIVSVASISACVAALALLAWFENWDLFYAAVVAVALVIARHSANIGRLLRGEEPRIDLAGRREP